MDDALGPVFFQQGVDIGVGAAVVHDDGLVQFQCQPDLGLKQRQLGILGHGPVVIQPALPHSHHLGVLVIGGKGTHLCGPVAAVYRNGRGGAFLTAILRGQQAFRMDADSGVHPGISVGQFQHPGRIARMGGLLAHANHPFAGQAVQQGKAVRVKGAGAVMGVGVKDGVFHITGHAPFWRGPCLPARCRCRPAPAPPDTATGTAAPH